ncbi:autotransporter assembly complex protein TamA [Paenalcaligenes sp. Me131]|uniref:autotransporter assembly complex protein TamA n=1 Tax=Paenalcaligenes sp. Me131 TaxID=3392636 RepID=UPI003D2B9B15
MGVRTAGWMLALACSQSVSAAMVPEVVIDPGGVGPDALRVIHGAVEAITRLAEDQDLSEVSRLRRRAHDATISALQTQGYYDSIVTVEIGEIGEQETWDILIQPGVRTLVDKVDIKLSGQINQPEFAVRVEGLRADLPLKVGDVFLNNKWSSAKQDLLLGVKNKDFYFARYEQTRAVVHAEEGKADLELAIRSGPRVRMGQLYTSGLKRVPESLIHRYVRYSPGDPYDQDKLDEWQQALQNTSFFMGAFVTMDDTSPNQRVRSDGEVEIPVSIRVTEAPARRFTGSLGADSDHGIRAEGLYRQNVVFGLPVWTETGIGVDKDRQRFFTDVYLPPTIGGYQNSLGVLVQHEDIQGLETTRLAGGWKLSKERKSQAGVDYKVQWSLIGSWDENRIDGVGRFKTPSVIGTWQWLRRDVDSLYDPTSGNLLDLNLASGVSLKNKKPFYRTSLRAQQWWPVGTNDVLTVRGEVGKVWKDTEYVPPDFGFRTGGARSIRGYSYQSIGREQGDATVGAPALALASVEYTHYFTSMFGMTAFVDVGDAAESFGDMKAYLGYGLGAAVRTPAGPIYVDLAYGQRDHKLRLHFALGIAF